ncbi:MAG: hypothetical protein P8130_07580 [Deltaproteobacteria bacterium]
MIEKNWSAEEKLPYPTRPLKVKGGMAEEYIIPENRKAEVLKAFYIFSPVPSMDEERFDSFAGKKFQVGSFRVIWEDGQNYLVSPFYPSSGCTVLDWMPANFTDEE